MATRTLYDEDGNPIEVDFQDEDKNGPADLRKALKKEKEARETDAKELAQLRASVRETSVATVLKSKGVSEKIAKFIPSDISTSEAIDTWLKENGEIFNISVESQSSENSQRNQEQADLQGRLHGATESAVTPLKQEELIQKLKSNSMKIDEFNALVNGGEQSTWGNRF